MASMFRARASISFLDAKFGLERSMRIAISWFILKKPAILEGGGEES